MAELASENLEALRRNLKRIVAEEQARVGGRGSEKRRHQRHYYTVEAVVKYIKHFDRMGASAEQFTVLTKDLSRSGLSFIHKDEMYAGEIVRIEVNIEKVQRLLLVRITRCRRAGLKVFDVAGEFIDQAEVDAALAAAAVRAAGPAAGLVAEQRSKP
jgi:hypothetical protein